MRWQNRHAFSYTVALRVTRSNCFSELLYVGLLVADESTRICKCIKSNGDEHQVENERRRDYTSSELSVTSWISVFCDTHETCTSRRSPGGAIISGPMSGSQTRSWWPVWWSHKCHRSVRGWKQLNVTEIRGLEAHNSTLNLTETNG
jgi:hypothetical protein